MILCTSKPRRPFRSWVSEAGREGKKGAHWRGSRRFPFRPASHRQEETEASLPCEALFCTDRSALHTGSHPTCSWGQCGSSCIRAPCNLGSRARPPGLNPKRAWALQRDNNQSTPPSTLAHACHPPRSYPAGASERQRRTALPGPDALPGATTRKVQAT